jgi:glycosyltransferase involved in cell wall biosynthesis
MRVCLVSQEYPPGYVGGIGTQCRVKALALAALGHDVEVLTGGPSSGAALVTREDRGVRVHELRTPGGEFAVYRTETYWLGYTWAVFSALRSLGGARPFDVIDFPDYAGEGLAFQLDRCEDDPTAVVVHLHGSLSMFSEQIGWPEPGEPFHRVGTFIEDLSIEAADGLIAASHSVAELTARRLAIPLERITVIDGAVDTDAFSPAPARRSSDGELRLLFVGNVAANKGVYTVLEAFIRLARSHPRLSLLIAGTIEQERADEMRAEAAQAGLAERVTVLGFVEHRDLPELYRSADMLAAPSQFEGGLGMVYLEAMACGLPVVATAAGGAAEAIEPGETGILLEHGDVTEATAAIETLLVDGELRARMGAAGRTRVEDRFGPERYAARVAAAYEQATELRRGSVVQW